MLFQDAAMLVLDGQPVYRVRENGRTVVVHSEAHAYAKMGFDDWMADDWEIYTREREPLSSTWLP